MIEKASSDQNNSLHGGLKRYADPALIGREKDAWQAVVIDSVDTHRVIGVTTMSITELLPAVAALSHADKFQLVQFVLAQLAQEEGVPLAFPPAAPFDPRRFFGVAHQSRQAVDQDLASIREGWL